MRARNKVTGAAIVAMVETIPGRTAIEPTSFRRRGNDLEGRDAGCGVEIDWDGIEHASRKGKRLFADERGDMVTEDEIELQNEEPAE